MKALISINRLLMGTLCSFRWGRVNPAPPSGENSQCFKPMAFLRSTGLEAQCSPLICRLSINDFLASLVEVYGDIIKRQIWVSEQQQEFHMVSQALVPTGADTFILNSSAVEVLQRPPKVLFFCSWYHHADTWEMSLLFLFYLFNTLQPILGISEKGN